MAEVSKPTFNSRALTAIRIGPLNVARVIWHRLLIKSGNFRSRYPICSPTTVSTLATDGLAEPFEVPGSKDVIRTANELVSGRIRYFSSLEVNFEGSPNWFLNPYAESEFPQTSAHWSELRDFNPRVGDIKTVWEPSRFAWCLTFVQAALASGSASYLATANAWIANWLRANPYNAGPNWMCGQETAIRLLHVLLADSLLRKHAGGDSDLEEFVFEHCRRIQATTTYAIAQNNNHVISEAVGLFVGGHWLVLHGKQHQRFGRKIQRVGRQLLERHVRKLVLSDGTFSQFSTNYHRLFLETLSIAEWWRHESGLPRFSDDFYKKASKATGWLTHMIDEISGDVANIGANDGAQIYRLSSTGYRDYRPTAQLAAAIFLGKRAIEPTGAWDEPLAWLGIDAPIEVAPLEKIACHADGGFTMMRHADADSFVVCRGASRRFRPSQADALHCDVWWRGVNLARDAGTFSYAGDDRVLAYYKGTAAHNTVQFDERNQMRTIGRFLFGDWLECDEFGAGESAGRGKWSAGYTDYRGCTHQRTVEEIDAGWQVTDRLNGPFDEATLRWRLAPEWQWQQDSNSAVSQHASVALTSNVAFSSIEIVDGRESRYYHEETPLRVLAATVASGDCEITSIIRTSSQ